MNMPGPYICSRYSYPSIGWLMYFENQENVERVTRVEHDQFWTSLIEVNWDENISWNDAHDSDLAEYGNSGPYLKVGFGDVAIGQYVYMFELQQVTFVGRHTFNMVSINDVDDVEMIA